MSKGSHMKTAAALALTLLLGACATAPKPIYHWGSYQPALYAHFKGDDAKAQELLDKLQVQLAETQQSNLLPPPGLHGHMALLNAKLGRSEESRRHLERERQLFPESAAYIDMLLRNTQKSSPAG